jgi:hypothetical protein
MKDGFGMSRHFSFVIPSFYNLPLAINAVWVVTERYLKT